MTKEAIKKNIATLAQSQGFYGRLLNQIEDDEAVLDYLYEQSVKKAGKMQLIWLSLLKVKK